MKKDKNDSLEGLRQFGIVSTLPFVLVAGPLLGFFVGKWVDNRWDTAPYGMIILLILGFVASARETIRMIKSVNQSGQ